MTKDNIYFYVLGVPVGFDNYPSQLPFTENQSYFSFFYNKRLSDGEVYTFKILREGNFVSYTVLRYYINEAKDSSGTLGRNGSFIGASIVLQDHFITDPHRIYNFIQLFRDSFFAHFLDNTSEYAKFRLTKLKDAYDAQGRQIVDDVYTPWIKDQIQKEFIDKGFVCPLSELKTIPQENYSNNTVISLKIRDSKSGELIDNPSLNKENLSLMMETSPMVTISTAIEESRVEYFLPIEVGEKLIVWRSKLYRALEKTGVINNNLSLANIYWSSLWERASLEERKLRFQKLYENLEELVPSISGSEKTTSSDIAPYFKEFEKVQNNLLFEDCKDEYKAVVDGIAILEKSIGQEDPIPRPKPKTDPERESPKEETGDIAQLRAWRQKLVLLYKRQNIAVGSCPEGDDLDQQPSLSLAQFVHKDLWRSLQPEDRRNKFRELSRELEQSLQSIEPCLRRNRTSSSPLYIMAREDYKEFKNFVRKYRGTSGGGFNKQAIFAVFSLLLVSIVAILLLKGGGGLSSDGNDQDSTAVTKENIREEKKTESVNAIKRDIEKLISQEQYLKDSEDKSKPQSFDFKELDSLLRCLSEAKGSTLDNYFKEKVLPKVLPKVLTLTPKRKHFGIRLSNGVQVFCRFTNKLLAKGVITDSCSISARKSYADRLFQYYFKWYYDFLKEPKNYKGTVIKNKEADQIKRWASRGGTVNAKWLNAKFKTLEEERVKCEESLQIEWSSEQEELRKEAEDMVGGKYKLWLNQQSTSSTGSHDQASSEAGSSFTEMYGC